MEGSKSFRIWDLDKDCVGLGCCGLGKESVKWVGMCGVGLLSFSCGSRVGLIISFRGDFCFCLDFFFD